MLNALPVFHSFGLTGGLLLPLLAGVRTFLYPSPLHYRTVPELAYGINATILFGTDTFLAGYARVADNYDFYSVRYVFAGAERVKAGDAARVVREVRHPDPRGLRRHRDRAGARRQHADALQGRHGRAPASRASTHRLEPVAGIDQGGRLFVRGPNVMLGYLRAERPACWSRPTAAGTTPATSSRSTPRASSPSRGARSASPRSRARWCRSATVEDLVARVWPAAIHAVVAVPDPKRGEQLVLVTEQKDASRGALAAAAREAGLPEIFVPRSIVPVAAFRSSAPARSTT